MNENPSLPSDFAIEQMDDEQAFIAISSLPNDMKVKAQDYFARGRTPRVALRLAIFYIERYRDQLAEIAALPLETRLEAYSLIDDGLIPTLALSAVEDDDNFE